MDWEGHTKQGGTQRAAFFFFFQYFSVNSKSNLEKEEEREERNKEHEERSSKGSRGGVREIVVDVDRVGPCVATIVRDGKSDGDLRVTDGLFTIPGVRAVPVHALSNSLGGGGLVGASGRKAARWDSVKVGIELIGNVDVRSKALKLSGGNKLGNRHERVDAVDGMRIVEATDVATSVIGAVNTTTGESRTGNRKLNGQGGFIRGRGIQETTNDGCLSDGDSLRKNGEEVGKVSWNILPNTVIDEFKVVVAELLEVGSQTSELSGVVNTAIKGDRHVDRRGVGNKAAREGGCKTIHGEGEKILGGGDLPLAIVVPGGGISGFRNGIRSSSEVVSVDGNSDR